MLQCYNQKNKEIKINNRRYLGNKYKLLPFISDIVKKECKNIYSFADIFAGTGSVSSLFYDKKIITNDLLYSNYISNLAWFGAQEFDFDKIVEYITNYNELEINEENYMTYNFSNTYFSYQDCAKIGFIIDDIVFKYIIKLFIERFNYTNKL